MTPAQTPGPGQSALVLGGGGFLGRAVCKDLRTRGLTVLAADLTPATDTDEAVVALDISDRDAVSDLVRSDSPSVIINLSYVVEPALAADLHKAVSVNQLGQINCLDAAVASGVPRYVNASSIASYGPDQAYYGVRAITEADGCPPDRHRGLYGPMKAFDELVAAQYADRIGTCNIRFNVIFGPGRRNGFTAWTSVLAGDDMETPVEIPLAPDQRISLISVTDAARLVSLVATAPALPGPALNSGVTVP